MILLVVLKLLLNLFKGQEDQTHLFFDKLILWRDEHLRHLLAISDSAFTVILFVEHLLDSPENNLLFFVEQILVGLVKPRNESVMRDVGKERAREFECKVARRVILFVENHFIVLSI